MGARQSTSSALVKLTASPLFRAVARGAKVLAAGETVADDFREGRWIAALIKVTAMASEFASETVNAEASFDPFDDNSMWVQPFRVELVPLAFSVLRDSREIERVEAAVQASAVTLLRSTVIAQSPGGCAVGWRRGWETTPTEIYCAPGDVQRLRAEVAEALQKKHAGRIAQVRMRRFAGRWGADTSCVEARLVKIRPAVPSGVVSSITERWRPMVADGVSRSALLAGPPGTGKSTAAQAIVSSLGLSCLQIAVSDVMDFDAHVLRDLVDLTRAEALIIDDIDRIEPSAQRQLLSTTEDLAEVLRVVVVTANRPKLLDVACVRPGRFDEIVKVDALDEAAIRAILGPAAQDAYDEVRDWPIAFVREYGLRRRYLSREAARASMVELRERVAELRAAQERADADDEPRVGEA